MFRFTKKCFFIAVTFLSWNAIPLNALECVSMNNQECKIKTKIIDINRNESSFYPFSVSVNKCNDSCNNINDPYASLCFSNVIQNIKVNLMSRTNETRHIEWYETCKYKCRLNTSVCNNKQRWNKECRYECNELIDKGSWDKGFIWNPSN